MERRMPIGSGIAVPSFPLPDKEGERAVAGCRGRRNRTVLRLSRITSGVPDSPFSALATLRLGL
jgi:hypothetical protein